MRKIIRILLATVACFSACLLFAQTDSSFRFVRAFSGDIIDFEVDNLDNIYVISSSNQVKLLNSEADSIAVYNDIRKYGKATMLDASNPLKLLLYYRDFSTIVVLDRFMNVRSTIDLRKQNIYQVKTIGLAYDNNIWVFDEVENKLKKIDEEGKLLLETPDLRQIFTDPPSPQQIFDRDGFVYLYDSARGVYVFDYYGTLKNKILITGWDNLKIVNRYIFGTREYSLQRYEIRTFKLDDLSLPLPLRGAALRFTATKLYALKDGVLQVYSL
jgi:hypothetical protein